MVTTMRVRTRKSNRRAKVYIVSACAALLASGAALLCFSAIVFALKLPVAQSGFFSFLAFGIGCVVAGYVSGAYKRQGGIMSGVKAALVFALPIALVGFVIAGSAVVDVSAEAVSAVEPAVTARLGVFNKVFVAVLCGGVGGVLGVNRNGGFG